MNEADVGISNVRIQARQNHLRDAKWYAFDLHDTLHGFRKASAAAVTTVLRILNGQRHPESALEDLEMEYKRILARGTASAFVDGRTSHQYREDRLQQNFELKPGVLDLLKTLKQYGHMIAVITEGPQDGQERTVEALGLMPYIDYLATTNKLGVAKTDGLFVKVLEHLGLEPNEMIMTGDGWERDIVPATQAGIYCVHYTDMMPMTM
ncbi:HAD-like protein [Lizonia empirigonia]|nr:HAD-like protein [Lizonia empirigonia]